MNKEKLEQEAKDYLRVQTQLNGGGLFSCNVKNLIVGFAESKEKRIEELEQQIEKLKADLNEAIEDANRWEETETFSVLNRIYNDNFEVVTSVSN